MAERLVVVGGDAAGMTAATNARRRLGPDQLEIVALERGEFTSYSACGIPYYLGGVVQPLSKLIVRTPEEFAARNRIEVRIRQEAIEIDLDGRGVRVRNLDNGSELMERFDHLVLGMGGTPERLPVKGADARGIFGVQTLGDAVAVERFIETEKPQHAVIVGGGYIGIEMAEALANLEMKVTMIVRSAQPMPTLDPDMGALVADAMRDMGLEVLTEEPVTGFDSRDGKVATVVTENDELPADIVVLGLGVRPNSGLAEESGIHIGPSGGIEVDQRLETSVEGVWAAGDCAEKFHRVSRKPVAFALGTHANKEGRVAGINLSGGYATFPGIVGTAVSKVCGLEVARTGLTESEADDAGFASLTATVDSSTRAGYYPGATPIRTKLVVERGSGRLLGAQIVGREGAAKRIDVLAATLWTEMTVEEVINLDLGYAPPFSPLWDPVLVAARKAWQAVQSAG